VPQDPAERGRGPYAVAAAGLLAPWGVIKDLPGCLKDRTQVTRSRGAVGITVSLFRFEDKERAGECRRAGGDRRGVPGGAKWRMEQLPEPWLEPRLGAPAGGPGGGARFGDQRSPRTARKGGLARSRRRHGGLRAERCNPATKGAGDSAT